MKNGSNGEEEKAIIIDEIKKRKKIEGSGSFVDVILPMTGKSE